MLLLLFMIIIGYCPVQGAVKTILYIQIETKLAINLLGFYSSKHWFSASVLHNCSCFKTVKE